MESDREHFSDDDSPMVSEMCIYFQMAKNYLRLVGYER